MTDIRINVHENIRQALRGIAWLHPDKRKKIIAHGMNKTMKSIRSKEQREMQSIFDRPTRYTLNSFYTVPATESRLAVEIRIKNDGNGVAPVKYLAPEIYGGGRRMKGFEIALKGLGVLPDGMYAMPARHAPLDAFGNISGGFLRRLIARLSQQQGQGQQGRRRTRGNPVFAANGSRGLPAGIYEGSGRNIKMLIKFVGSQPVYARTFDFFGVAQGIVNRFLAGDIRTAAQQALRDDSRISSNLSRSVSDLLRGNR